MHANIHNIHVMYMFANIHNIHTMLYVYTYIIALTTGIENADDDYGDDDDDDYGDNDDDDDDDYDKC